MAFHNNNGPVIVVKLEKRRARDLEGEAEAPLG